MRREDFDRLLFDNACAAGAIAVQDTAVRQVAFDRDGAVARATTRQGQEVVYRARYVIDASGRDTLLGKLLGLRRRHRHHQSAALYAHYTGVTRRSGDDAGNISIYRTVDGWVWVIPLPGDVTSVGLVCGPQTLRQRAGDTAGFLDRTLRAVPGLAERLACARLAGNLHATGNYSYECTRKAGRHWIMVGDAGAFVDPIFSSGVHFALHGGLAAAQLVDAVLDAPALERRLQRAYVASERAALSRVSWFIVRFNTPVMRALFANPRNDWRLREAMISMLAGDLHRDAGIGWRLRVFKVIYYLSCLRDVPAWLRGSVQTRRRRREVYPTDSRAGEPS